MPDLISWPADSVCLERATRVLREGGVIAVPTETGYEAVASALAEGAVDRLTALVGASHPLAVVLKSPGEVLDWVPLLEGAGLRLPRYFWPGPLIMMSAAGLEMGLATRLPNRTRAALIREHGMAFRMPDRDDLAPLWRSLEGPVCSACLPGHPTTAASLSDQVGLDLILDGGPAPLSVPPTIVAVHGRQAKVLREGVIPASDVAVASRCRVVFVCTGNTCRSPMAEALCRGLLADTLGCRIDQLVERGFEIASAGLAAMPGQQASPEAVEIVRELGSDLADHQSQPLSMDLISQSDLVFTMTAGHLRMLQSLRLPLGPEPRMLSHLAEDVPDPIGGPLERYQECADQILHCLRQRLAQILEG